MNGDGVVLSAGGAWRVVHRFTKLKHVVLHLLEHEVRIRLTTLVEESIRSLGGTASSAPTRSGLESVTAVLVGLGEPTAVLGELDLLLRLEV